MHLDSYCGLPSLSVSFLGSRQDIRGQAFIGSPSFAVCTTSPLTTLNSHQEDFPFIEWRFNGKCSQTGAEKLAN